jgi:hypothetical protein
MGECSILEKLDPYKILQYIPKDINVLIMNKINKIIEKFNKNPLSISYE